jgi:hypothetical protein
VRHCQVEILPGQYGYVPVASTSLDTDPRPEPTLLTRSALEELVAAFQAACGTRRAMHGTKRKSSGLGSAAGRRATSGRRGNHRHSHGGDRT